MIDPEKNQPPVPLTTSPSAKPRWSRAPLVLLASILLLSGYHCNLFSSSLDAEKGPHYSTEQLLDARCPPQPAPLNIGSDWNPLGDESFAALLAKRLSKAVQIRTESYDDFPRNGSDPVYDKHFALSNFLENEFPKLFADPIKHEYINTHGHLFTWEGSKPELQPMILMAHTDTVPVLDATLGQWKYPPFEGKISVDATPNTPGTWIWGRGSSDCKNSLLGIYAAIERLVTEGFQPDRTILIANGYDEEIGGNMGAGAIAKTILERYGPNSMAFLVDEGFSGISQEYGTQVASFGMAEKGSVNVKLTVETLGGHSSVPPTHTGIGIAALFLSELEAHPFEPTLDPAGPFLKQLNCLAEHAPGMPRSLKRSIKDPKQWPKLAKELARTEVDGKLLYNSLLATSTAIDIVQGGVKVNALPEVVEATVNHRISFTSSIDDTLDHWKSLMVPLAHKLNFTISPFDRSPKASPFHITLEIPGDVAMQPAPITSPKDKSYALMGGTTRTVFGEETIISPTGMYANTDTRHFWDLTRNLYRFTPAVIADNVNQHTVDERISLDGHLNTTRFYYKLIQNTIGWDD